MLVGVIVGRRRRSVAVFRPDEGPDLDGPATHVVRGAVKEGGLRGAFGGKDDEAHGAGPRGADVAVRSGLRPGAHGEQDDVLDGTELLEMEAQEVRTAEAEFVDLAHSNDKSDTVLRGDAQSLNQVQTRLLLFVLFFSLERGGGVRADGVGVVKRLGRGGAALVELVLEDVDEFLANLSKFLSSAKLLHERENQGSNCVSMRRRVHGRTIRDVRISVVCVKHPAVCPCSVSCFLYSCVGKFFAVRMSTNLYASFSAFCPCDFPISAITICPDSSYLAVAPSSVPSVTVFASPFHRPFAFIRPQSTNPTTALLFTSNEEIVVASGDLLTLWDFRSATLRHSVVLAAPSVLLRVAGGTLFARLENSQLLSLEAHSLKRPKEIGNFCKNFDLDEKIGIFSLLEEGVNFHKFPITSSEPSRTDRAAVKQASEIFVIGNVYFVVSLARVLVFSSLTGELLHIVDAAFSLDELGATFGGFFPQKKKPGKKSLLAWRSDGSKVEIGADGTRKFLDGNFRSIKTLVSEEVLVDIDGHVLIGNDRKFRKIFPIKKDRTSHPRCLLAGEDGNLYLAKFPIIENLFTGARIEISVPDFFGKISAVTAVDRKFLVFGSTSGQVAVFEIGNLKSDSPISVFAASTPSAVAALAPTGNGEFAVVDETNAIGNFSIRGERKFKLRPAVDLIENFWELENGVLKFPILKYSEEWDISEGALIRSSFNSGRAAPPSRKFLHEISGVSVLREAVELNLETTNFAGISDLFYSKLLDLPLGLRSPGGYVLLFDWRQGERRKIFLRPFDGLSSGGRLPLGARRRSASQGGFFPAEKKPPKKKSVWNSWMGFLLDAKHSVAEISDPHARTLELSPFFAEGGFSMKILLDGLRSSFNLNRVLAYNHLRRLLKDDSEEGAGGGSEKTSGQFPGDSRNVVYLIGMSTELNFRSQLFPAIVDPLLRLTIEGDPTAEKIFCEIFFAVKKRLSGEEQQRLLLTLAGEVGGEKKPPKKNPRKKTLNAPNPLLTVAEADLDRFMHEIVASEIRRGNFDVFNLVVGIVRRSPRNVLKEIGNFCRGVMRCAEILGERKKTCRELSLLLNVLVEKFPMVAFHKASQRLLAGSLAGEILHFDLKHFHEKQITKISDPISALAVNSEASLVACLAKDKISVFKISHHHSSFFSLFKSSSSSSLATSVAEFSLASGPASHPMSLATPLDGVRLFWPTDEFFALIDSANGHEQKFPTNNLV